MLQILEKRLIDTANMNCSVMPFPLATATLIFFLFLFF